MAQIYDMLIIGGGPAGYTAALYASRAGMDTVVIEKISAGGQMALTDIIDNYPGFEEGIDGFTLGMKMQQCAQRFGAKTEYAEVTSVDFSQDIKKVETANGIFLGKTVVISTGANPRKLGLTNEEELLVKAFITALTATVGFTRIGQSLLLEAATVLRQMHCIFLELQKRFMWFTAEIHLEQPRFITSL